MKKYLLAHQIPENRIVAEDRSTSTYENFVFSKKKLEKKLPRGFRVTYITNDFHIYRAGQIAGQAGLSSSCYAAKTEWYMVPCVYAREVLAILKSWVFGYR